MKSCTEGPFTTLWALSDFGVLGQELGLGLVN